MHLNGPAFWKSWPSAPQSNPSLWPGPLGAFSINRRQPFFFSRRTGGDPKIVVSNEFFRETPLLRITHKKKSASDRQPSENGGRNLRVRIPLFCVIFAFLSLLRSGRAFSNAYTFTLWSHVVSLFSGSPINPVDMAGEGGGFTRCPYFYIKLV